MDKKEVKELLLDNFKQLEKMPVQEVLLYKKGIQLNSDKMLDGFEKNKKKIEEIKSNIGVPKDPHDYQNLNIKVIPVRKDNDLSERWNILRHFTSSAVGNSSPGRLLKFIVVHEENSEDDPFGFGLGNPKWKYLGVISISSDFIAMGGRDDIIGGTREQRLNGKLKNTCIGSSIVPTQPLGFSYVGGKLIALMTISNVIEQEGNRNYEETLAGVTTTSLFGGFSQYNNLKYWKKCGSSKGQIDLEPSDEVYKKVREGGKENFPNEVNEIERSDTKKITSRPKIKVLNMLYKKLGKGIKPPSANAPRGVYWCDLYNNTRRFLREEDNELGEKRFDNSVETLSQLGKDKYASKRVNKLLKDDRFSTEILFYDDIINISGEETKNKYMKDVGR